MECKFVGPSVGAVVLVLCARVASASAIEFTDPTAFDAAVLSPTTYNFEGLVPVGGAALGGVTVGGVQFTGGGSVNEQAAVFDGSYGAGSYGSSFFSDQSLDGVTPATVVATLSGATAVGFTYGDFVDSAIPFIVTLSTGDSFALTTPLTAGVDTGFVGFTSSTPITSITFADGGFDFDVTQFVLAGSPTGVPEPATLSLFGLGLAGVAFMRRRKRAESI